MNKRNFTICGLILFLSMVCTKALAYDIAVENAEGVTIYYNYINNGLDLEVTYLEHVYDYNRNTYTGTIIIPEEVTFMDRTRKVIAIGNAAFAGCRDLTNLTLPNSVTSIGRNAFYACAFSSFNIPNGVTSIGNGAFMYCIQMTDVTIPYSVTDIGSGAFYFCSGLTSVHITSIEAWCKIQFDMSAEGTNPLHYAHHLFLNGEEVKDVVFPNNITSINGVFDGCSELTSVVIQSGVTSIGDFSFRDCISLTSITLPENVISIGWGAFKNCSSLASINIPMNVTSIGSYAFWGCESLTSINIQENVTVINYSTFQDCKSLTSVKLPNSLITIDHHAFNGCSSLKSIVIPDGVTTIGQCAFANCISMTSVKIPKNVTSIDQRAFEGDNLTTIKSMVENPFVIDGNTFSQNSFMNATLYVPVGSINKYKETDGWKKFVFIEELMLYKLTYMVDGELYKTYDYEYGEVITPEEEPTKEGYTFSGWSEIPETMPEYDVTVTGSFNVNKYKLTYIVDGEVYKSLELEYGSTITPEEVPTKEGYTFSGWSEIPEKMPAEDVTVTGTFSINSYKLTYLIDDVVYKTYELEYGAIITPEAEPTKDGYTFSGWSWIPSKMPAEDVTVTGSFIPNIYKLTYIVDGEVYKSYEVPCGTTITPEAEPTKEGYTFSGWSWIPNKMPAEDVTVTGSFNINTYKLTYLVDNEEYKTYEIDFGAIITPEEEPTKEGYTFSGWSEIPETMPAHDVTVTGSFSINTYKLIYIVDGEAYMTYELDFGTIIIPEAEPAREGYTFSGWSEIPATMPAYDVTVTGTFNINKYLLSYKINYEDYKQYEVEYDAEITPEPDPVKEGYSFSGWQGLPERMPAHDVTVVGFLSINKYWLTYEIDGVVYKKYQLEYGETVTIEPEPNKEGYTFSGWSEIPETMPSHDVTVTGSFSINSYTLTYMIGDEVYKQVVYEYGATITPEPQPEGDYKTFEWIDLPETMPAHDVVVYANYETGIAEIIALVKQGNARVYTPDGKPLSRPQKGLNIIVMKDGTVKKVFIK